MIQRDRSLQVFFKPMDAFNTSLIIRILFGWKNLSIDNLHEVPFEGYSFSSRIMVNMYIRNR